MKGKLLPLAAMEKLMKHCGAERVSDKAKAELKRIIEERALDIAEKAKQLAEHAGRKTIKSEDIRLAARN